MTMNRHDWLQIRNFSPQEFSRPDYMDFDFVRQLDAFRSKAGETVLINFSNGAEKHVAGSLHPQGKAADVMFRRKITLDDFFLATRFFTEVGIYPDWDRPDTKDHEGGLHVGYERFATAFPMHRKYWIGVKDAKGVTQYEAFSISNLKRFGLI